MLSTLHTESENAAESHSSAEEFDPLKMDLEALRRRLSQQGWFKSRGYFYPTQIFLVAVIFCLAFALLSLGTFAAMLASSVVLAVFNCQIIWFTHDFVHGQVIHNRSLRHRFYPVLALLQGLSLNWWERRHNQHHAHPNSFRRVDGKIEVIDPDIDSLPLMLWSQKLLNQGDADSKYVKFLMRTQRYTLWLMLTGLRPYWTFLGLRFGTASDRVVLVAHHLLILLLASWVSKASVLAVILWWFVASALSSLILASIFFFGHTGMDIYDSSTRKNHFRAQLRCTRNFTNNLVMRFFTGGLCLHIEHHFFPTMPRDRLLDVAPEIQKILGQHSQPYTVEAIPHIYSKIFRSISF